MKNTLFCLFAVLFLSLSITAQNNVTPPKSSNLATPGEKSRKPVFRATRDQIIEAQKALKLAENGKLSKEDRTAVKIYQSANGLKASGSLNRATLEKMGISLTQKQREIPVSANSFAKAAKTTSGVKRGPVFRATKEQVNQAQRMLKVAETGKLDDSTRESLRTYQQGNGIKSTGTLNKITLEKMGITLTDKQKSM